MPISTRRCQSATDRKSTRLNSSHLGISYAAFCLKQKSTRLNSSHLGISYAVFCLKKKKKNTRTSTLPPSDTRHISHLKRQGIDLLMHVHNTFYYRNRSRPMINNRGQNTRSPHAM